LNLIGVQHFERPWTGTNDESSNSRDSSVTASVQN
jgi:hypothetical protein